jgi:hypothetical protein
MLEELNTIPWEELDHAYGSAEDVPGNIRALYVPEDAEEALENLWSSICHQTSVYTASGPALPFLTEAACSPEIHDEVRGGLLLLIGTIAIGLYSDGGEEVEDWTQGYQTAVACLPRLLPLLTDESLSVQTRTAAILRYFPSEKDVLLPHLWGALNRTTDRMNRASALLSLYSLDPDETLETLRALLSNPDEALVVRFTAAVCLSQSNPEPALIPQILPVFADIFTNEETRDHWSTVAFDEPEASQMVTDVLENHLGTGATRTFLSVLLDRLEQADEDDMLHLVLSTIDLTFGSITVFSSDIPPRPTADLTADQIFALNAFAESDNFWQYDENKWLKYLGIPSEREALRQYLASTTGS